MWRWTVVVAVAAVVALALGGCGDSDGDGEGAGAGGRAEVVAGFHPLAELTATIGGDRVEVDDVTPSRAEPHDVELTTDQVDAVEDADLVVVLGGGFQPAVEQAAARRSGAVVDVLAGLGHEAEGHEAEEHEAEEHEADDHGHVDDPHVWLDPLAMADIGDLVAAGLTEADPGGAATYRAAAADWRAEMQALHGRYEHALSSCERRTVIVGHESFGWLADRYGLEQHGIEGADPHGEPDPRRLDELADVIAAERLTTVFHEPGAADSAARTLARETGAELAALDSLERPPTDGGPATYIDRMDANLVALVSALGCATT